MTKRMLIDDTQPEETRVVIVNGNKVEDVEFESSFRKQIKGNIYLAKVMRIEPSLQAAFVDYGGNKHGFLAFGEIHPDYYHVSDETMAEIEKEVDEAIEAKKQYLKEKELERERHREEKAKERARIEEEKRLTIEQAAASLEQAAEIEQPKESEQPSSEPSVSEENSATTEDLAFTEDDEKHKRKKRILKKRIKKQQEQKQAEVTVVDTEEKTKEKITVMAAETAEAEAIREDISINDAEDENDGIDDDDDDSEYDFELQRKLMKLRKLFHRSTIQDVIKEGQILLVQVVKEERGNKGAALTTYLSLAGRYCVLMPNRIKSGGVSRKITNIADRKRLKNIIHELPISSDMSMIVRTAGEDKTKADIIRDYNYLIRSWNQIRLSALKNKAPYMIYEEGNLIKRALRDMFTKDISEIIVDGDNAYREAREFTKILSPYNLKKLKANKKGDLPIFQRFQVETQLDKLHDTNVQLESGGYLVINPTEALVSIDVNSGRATKEKDLEETALKTNLEAADEIAKQLRMRNLAGLVVVDFIDMDDPKNNIAVEKRMKEAMKSDRARVQIAKMSIFGLLEISRQRMHSSFFESNYQVCPYCQGKGLVRTMESSAVMVLRAIEEEGLRFRSSQISVFVPSDIAIFLLNHKRQKLSEMEMQYNLQIIISADDSIKNVSDYRIERIKALKQPSEQPKPTIQEIETDESSIPANDVSDEAEESFTEDSEKSNHFNKRYKDRRNRRNYNRDYKKRNRNKTEEEQPSTANNEAVILYNSHEDITSSPVQEQQAESKGKTTWWKKLIKS